MIEYLKAYVKAYLKAFYFDKIPHPTIQYHLADKAEDPEDLKRVTMAIFAGSSMDKIVEILRCKHEWDGGYVSHYQHCEYGNNPLGKHIIATSTAPTCTKCEAMKNVTITETTEEAMIEMGKITQYADYRVAPHNPFSESYGFGND